MNKLSDRAKRRLKMAAKLLEYADGKSKKLPIKRETFYDDIQVLISGLEPEKRDRLKALVEWVEAYDNIQN